MKELSVKEATELLNVSERTIRRMIKRGDFPNTYKRDQKIWIPQSDIDAYLQQQHATSGPEIESQPEPQVEPEFTPELPEMGPSELSPTGETQAETASKPSASPGAPAPKEVPAPEPRSQTPEPPIHGPAGESSSSPILEAELAPVETQLVTESQPEEQLPTPEPVTPAAEVLPSVAASQSETRLLKPEWEKTLQTVMQVLVDVGIISSGWLAQLFKTIHAKLEQYKAQTFPESPEAKDPARRRDQEDKEEH